MRGYLAGPMCGYELYNFPAFHAAAANLRTLGWSIISPAEMDLELGLDPAEDLPDWFTLAGAMQRDLHEITHEDTDSIILLPRWEPSDGARRELQVSIWCNRNVYLYDEAELMAPLIDITPIAAALLRDAEEEAKIGV